MFITFLIIVLILIAILRRNKNQSTPLSNSVQNESRTEYLKKTIEELALIVAHDENKKLSEQLADYREELKDLEKQDNTASLFITAKDIEPSSSSHNPEIFKEDLNQLWSNWYSTNSINLLLYIGAFLIVASASIFVGFQWSTLPGEIKSLMISLLTLAFFGFGLYFHKLPRIRNAGATFTAIGALLIPFSGMAWYNFVFQYTSITLGQVWLFTSIISATTNAALAYYFKNPLYTYFASFGSLSFVLSMINIYNLNSEFYILGSIITSFVLLLSQLFISKKDKQNIELYAKPLELSANILMPISLTIGGLFALSYPNPFTAEVTISAILASAYYFACYAIYKKPVYLLVSEVIFPISVIILFNWQRFPVINLLYTLAILGFIDLQLAKSFWKNKLQEEGDISLYIGLAKTALVFILSLLTSQEPIHQITLSLVTIGSGAFTTWITKNTKYLLLSTIIFLFTIYLATTELLTIPNKTNILALIYLAFGVIFYFTSVRLKNQQSSLSAFLPSTGIYLTLSFILNLTSSGYLLITNITITTILMLATIQFSLKETIYLAGAFFNLTVYNLLVYLNITSYLYPLIYCALSFLSYFASKNLKEEFSEKVQIMALILNLLTPIIFGLFSFSSSHQMETNSLITAYGTVALFGIHAFLTQQASIGYLASAIAMVTYLWQVQFLGFDQTLVYTIPLGLYFIGLSYFRKLAEDEEKQKMFSLIGLLFLILPNLFLIYSENGQLYWLILICVGIGLISLGISLKDKTYSYGGIAAITLAILTQTFEFIFSLPKWVITGLGGIIFLGAAIFLLLKRKEED